MFNFLDPVIGYLSAHHHGFDDFLPMIPNLQELWGLSPTVQVIAMLILTLAVGGLCLYDYIYERKGVFYLLVLSELILFLFTILYAAQTDMRHDLSWFISPRRIGWIWSVVNFVIYGVVIFIQLSALQYTLTVFSVYNNNDYGNWTPMVGFWIAGMVIFSILMVISETVGAWAIVIYFVIIAGITLFQILSNTVSSRNIVKGLLIGVLYLAGSFAIMLNVVEFLAIVVFVSFIALLGIGSMSMKIVSGDSFTVRNSRGETGTLRRTGAGTAEDIYGNLFRKGPDGKWR